MHLYEFFSVPLHSKYKTLLFMLTDIEIAKSVKMRPINEVAAELGIHEDQVENYGRYIAKITTDKIDRNKFKNHHLILVTAISPTKAGNGKTTVSVGLALGMQKMGKGNPKGFQE
jgi:formate--tetrahydrofolate ligase